LGSQNFWSGAASVATIIGASVVIYAAVVAVGQLKEMTKARHLEAMLRVYDMIGSPEARASRRFIYGELRSAPGRVTAEERENIEEVSVMLDRIGALVSAGLVPRDVLFASHREMIIRSWEKLAPYVTYNRLHRYPSFASHFEKLASLARNYQATAADDAVPGPTSSETHSKD
jgi:hypothetical protein